MIQFEDVLSTLKITEAATSPPPATTTITTTTTAIVATNQTSLSGSLPVSSRRVYNQRNNVFKDQVRTVSSLAQARKRRRTNVQERRQSGTFMETLVGML